MAEEASIKSEIKNEIKSALESFSQEGVELYLGTRVPCLDQVPEPLSFLRDFVSQNRPVVIRGAVSHWPAVSKERSSKDISWMKKIQQLLQLCLYKPEFSGQTTI